jgi:hypothetical protein
MLISLMICTGVPPWWPGVLVDNEVIFSRAVEKNMLWRLHMLFSLQEGKEHSPRELSDDQCLVRG